VATTPYNLSGEAFLQAYSNETHNIKTNTSTSKTLKIPDDAKIAIFSCSEEFWVKPVAASDDTITIPTDDVVDGLAPRRSPGGFDVEAHRGKWLAINCKYTENIQVSFYS